MVASQQDVPCLTMRFGMSTLGLWKSGHMAVSGLFLHANYICPIEDPNCNANKQPNSKGNFYTHTKKNSKRNISNSSSPHKSLMCMTWFDHMKQKDFPSMAVAGSTAALTYWPHDLWIEAHRTRSKVTTGSWVAFMPGCQPPALDSSYMGNHLQTIHNHEYKWL